MGLDHICQQHVDEIVVVRHHKISDGIDGDHGNPNAHVSYAHSGEQTGEVPASQLTCLNEEQERQRAEKGKRCKRELIKVEQRWQRAETQPDHDWTTKPNENRLIKADTQRKSGKKITDTTNDARDRNTDQPSPEELGKYRPSNSMRANRVRLERYRIARSAVLGPASPKNPSDLGRVANPAPQTNLLHEHFANQLSVFDIPKLLFG